MDFSGFLATTNLTSEAPIDKSGRLIFKNVKYEFVFDQCLALDRLILLPNRKNAEPLFPLGPPMRRPNTFEKSRIDSTGLL